MGQRLTLQPKGAMPLERAFEQFIQTKTVMNISAESIKHYQFCFKYFNSSAKIGTVRKSPSNPKKGNATRDIP